MPATLKLYNTLTRRKEAFEPLHAGKVGLYVCGMTVYDYCHIGHARMLVAFDVVQRWLRARGYEVTYVRNITDIDDKIIRRAVENGETIGSLTSRFIAAMQEDEAALGIQRPDLEPRATDYVPQMLDLVGLLEKHGYAYRADNGDTLFRVRRFAGYGRLGGKSLDDLRAGERVAVAAGKEDPFDFVLWKAAKPDEPPEACWQSDYGRGRPGWHLECSAMSTRLLGHRYSVPLSKTTEGGRSARKRLRFPSGNRRIRWKTTTNPTLFKRDCCSVPRAGVWLRKKHTPISVLKFRRLQRRQAASLNKSKKRRRPPQIL